MEIKLKRARELARELRDRNDFHGVSEVQERIVELNKILEEL